MSQPTATDWGECRDCDVPLTPANAIEKRIAGQLLKPVRCRTCQSYRDTFGPENMFDSYNRPSECNSYPYH